MRAPCPLYVRGELPEGPSIAVVGTREPSDDAVAITRELVRDLVAAGVAIWSGGARGIDAIAHQAAIDAGGKTVVVNAAGLDHMGPKMNLALFDRVLASGGAFVARKEDALKASIPCFLARNEVLAA